MRRKPDPLPPGFVPPTPRRFRRVNGRPYVADVVDSVRVLVEGTLLSEAAIAKRTGIGVATVHDWIGKRGWVRPRDVPRSTRRVGRQRAGFERRLREAFGLVRALAEREVTALKRAETADPATLGKAQALAETAAGLCRPTRRVRTRTADVG